MQKQSLLFGFNEEERIVSVHQASDTSMRIFIRSPEGMYEKDVEFFPFFFLSDPAFLGTPQDKLWIKELQGSNHFRWICAFPRWSAMWDAVRELLEAYNSSTNTRIDSYAELPILHLRADAISQFLMQSGRTLFKGMAFDEIHRLQLDIETYSTKRFSNAKRPQDRITIIALSDNRGWRHAIDGRSLSEREMLVELVRIIRERDPDVIEGHNIYNFDLPYIMRRCDMHNVPFAIGRDNTVPRAFDSRASFAERSVDYTAIEIPGRHIIDTWLLLQSYDVSKRSLESYGLKAAARHFGFASQNRIYIEGDRISWYWDHEPDLLIRYAMDDVDETRQLADMLSPPYFYMSQMLPFNYGTVARIGSAAKIESLLLREYVRERHSIPRPEAGMQTGGGYTEIFYTGLLGPVVDADVESLYPSLMLHERISPESERLGIFLALLQELTTLRLDTKRKMKQAGDPIQRMRLDALQSSFKILINSFYGYLGYSRALFNDMKAADRVTKTGQKLLRSLIERLNAHGGTTIQVDTDGLLFVPPSGVETEQQEREFVRVLREELPAGINIAMNGRYQSILSYKKKNYALRGYDQRITIKGSSLTSRSIERFGRNFVQHCITALMDRNIAGLHALYLNLREDILTHRLTVEDFSRTETLRESLDDYQSLVAKGLRHRTASYEVAINSGLPWKVGDRITYYIAGTEANIKGSEHGRLADDWDPAFPDENIQFYLRRLDEFAAKFQTFFSPADHRAIFSPEDLFGFSAEGIQIITRKVTEGLEEEAERTDNEKSPDDPSIMLDI